MGVYIKVFIIAFIIFLAIDFLWLGVLSKKLYENEIGHLMKKDFNFIAAFIFYIIFIIGLTVFIIVPNIESESILKLILLAALFGLVTYSTYDLTNYATLEGFPLKIVFIDLLWGVSISTVTSLLTFVIYNWIFK